MNMMSVLVMTIHWPGRKENKMRKFFVLILALMMLGTIGFSQGKWRYNPFTGTRDYFVEGLSLTTAASGDIIYHNGTIWTRLAKGDNDQVLTLAAGLPSWAAAAGGADAFTLKVDAGATADYFGVAGGDGLFRFTANHFTMADGGNFVTLSLADHATARTALGLQIGTDVVAWDADLDTYAGITPSANVQTLLGNATFALFMADLSGTAGASFSWNDQALTSVGAIGSDTITLVANEDLTASGTGHITSGSEGFIVGTLTVTDGSIDDTDGSIALGATNLTGAGTIGSGAITSTVGYLYSAETTATPNAAFTVDWTAKQVQRVTITGAALDVTFTDPATSCKLVLIVVQGDGDDTIDWTNEASILWPGAVDPVLSTGNGDIDMITFYFDGTNYLGVANYDFN